MNIFNNFYIFYVYYLFLQNQKIYLKKHYYLDLYNMNQVYESKENVSI